MTNYMMLHKEIYFAEVEWNLIKINENSVFHYASLSFHNQTNNL